MENANKTGAKSLFNTVNIEINAFDLLELQYILEYSRERMEEEKDKHFYDLKKNSITLCKMRGFMQAIQIIIP